MATNYTSEIETFLENSKQFDFFEQSSAASGIDYKFTSRIEILDGGNGANEVGVLETWELYGCMLQSANYNTLNYATNDAVTISLNIRYDNAIQFGAYEEFVGIGSNEGRATNASVGGTTVNG